MPPLRWWLELLLFDDVACGCCCGGGLGRGGKVFLITPNTPPISSNAMGTHLHASDSTICRSTWNDSAWVFCRYSLTFICKASKRLLLSAPQNSLPKLTIVETAHSTARKSSNGIAAGMARHRSMSATAAATRFQRADRSTIMRS